MKKKDGDYAPVVVTALTNAMGPTLLKTARVNAISRTQKMKVNVILDEGAMRSFITSQCAKNMGSKEESSNQSGCLWREDGYSKKNVNHNASPPNH